MAPREKINTPDAEILRGHCPDGGASGYDSPSGGGRASFHTLTDADWEIALRYSRGLPNEVREQIRAEVRRRGLMP